MRKFLSVPLATVGAAALVLSAAAPALAEVTFHEKDLINSDTGEVIAEKGTGFVGKGDVQLALGWNNKQSTERAENVTFRYSMTEVVERDCVTGTGQSRVRASVQTTDGLNRNVVQDTRTNAKGNITGYNLTGFSGAPVRTEGAYTCDGRLQGSETTVSSVSTLTATWSTQSGVVWTVTVPAPAA